MALWAAACRTSLMPDIPVPPRQSPLTPRHPPTRLWCEGVPTEARRPCHTPFPAPHLHSCTPAARRLAPLPCQAPTPPQPPCQGGWAIPPETPRRAMLVTIGEFGNAVRQLQYTTYMQVAASNWLAGEESIASLGGQTVLRSPTTGEFSMGPQGSRYCCVDPAGHTFVTTDDRRGTGPSCQTRLTLDARGRGASSGGPRARCSPSPGAQEDDGDEQAPQDHPVELPPPGDLREGDKRPGPDDGAGQPLRPAEDGREDELQGPRPVHLLGRHLSRDLAEEASRETCEDA